MRAVLGLALAAGCYGPKAPAGARATPQGAVATLQTVVWPLPTTLVTPGAPVYLELENASSDGVFYFDTLGMTPPQLVVDYR